MTAELLPGSGVTAEQVWDGLAELVRTFAPRHRDVLAVRDRLQAQIDEWHRAHPAESHDPAAYRAFLESIGYLVPNGEPFEIDTADVDPEIATLAGPQLVVPSTNARYSINAANARWGSLYDALYGTDAMGEPPSPGRTIRPAAPSVVAWTRAFLDDVVPLDDGSHADVVRYSVDTDAWTLIAERADGSCAGLRDAAALQGHRGTPDDPSALLLEHHGLGIELLIDRAHPVGAADAAGVADVVLEAAVTTIVDFEDSVATVDGPDKVGAYRTWLGLMKGDLTADVTKGDRSFVRTLAADREYTGRDGVPMVRRGRALLLVRNVGHLMTTPAVLDVDGQPVPEGIVDALISAVAARHDLARPLADRNSPAGSIYVVKPKMHGPDEVALTDDLFAAVEAIARPGRRTRSRSGSWTRSAARRSTSPSASAPPGRAWCSSTPASSTAPATRSTPRCSPAPMVRKADMRSQRWIQAYEDWNVDIGLGLRSARAGPRSARACGPRPTAWPTAGAEDRAPHGRRQLRVGAVPDRGDAARHALPPGRRRARASASCPVARRGPRIDDLLTIPLAGPAAEWTDDERRAEVDNNVQGILGYVVRWIDQGIGCSKVPDINGVALMEDRATCRISSQHVANWLLHGVVTEEQVRDSFRRMAVVVDGQNADDPAYVPMAPTFDGCAFLAASELVFAGTRSAERLHRAHPPPPPGRAAARAATGRAADAPRPTRPRQPRARCTRRA